MDVIFIRAGISSRFLGVTSAAVATGLAILLYLRVFEPLERKRGDLARVWAARWAGPPASPSNETGA